MIPREVAAKVRHIEIVTNRLVNEVMGGSYHSVFKGRGMEFEEVREYMPGDEIRTIDWNVTARAGAPFVKVHREERELTVMLLVDLSGSTDFGSGERLKGELAAEICALLAFSAIKNNDRVGLMIFTDRIEKFIPPKKGKNHVLRVIREVLFHRPAGRGTNIPGAVEHLMKVASRKAVVFLISDFVATDLRRSLAVLNRNHDLVAVKVRDRREFEIPAMGVVAFEDPESGEVYVVDTMDRGFRKRFSEVAERRHREARDLFRELKIDFVDIRTDKSYIDPIIELFRRRANRY